MLRKIDEDKRIEILFELYDGHRTKVEKLGCVDEVEEIFSFVDTWLDKNSTVISHYKRFLMEDSQLRVDYGAHNAFFSCKNVVLEM